MQLVLSNPALYALELTPLCNQRCPGCFNAWGDDPATWPTLSATQWRTILAKIQPHASRLKLTGGEPTLHPEFEAIAETIAELGISFSLFTNGRWRDPERMVCYLKENTACVGLLISLHGAHPESHEAYSRVPGSFQETVDNIRLAAEAGLSVTTSTVITRHNCRELPQLVAFSAALGADHATVNRYLGVPLPEIEPSNDELKEAVREVERLRQERARVTWGNCIPACFVDNTSTGCLAGIAYCTIGSDGWLRPCSHSHIRCGDLLQVSVEEAWHSEEMEAWRQLMPGECESSCAAFSTCHGGCRAIVEVRDGKRDPLRGKPINLSQSGTSERLSLYEGLRPVGTYHLREEPFGYVLIRGNRMAPVAFEDRAILNACDGLHTLQDIQTTYGQHGLQMVVELYRRGLLEWAEG